MFCMQRRMLLQKLQSRITVGATLYVTASPCIECAKLIIQAGIKRVVYSEDYRSADGVELLRKADIEVELIEIE